MDSAERRAVRQALDALKPVLEAFLAQHRIPVEAAIRGRSSAAPDIHALLKACAFTWDLGLDAVLPRIARTYAHELIDVRNRWAHEEAFSTAEARRAEDTARLFGELLGAPQMPSQAARGSSLSQSTPAKARVTQRDMMTRIFAAVGRDPERAIREYAAAERRGEIVRKSNKHGTDAESYARALLADGQKKGWL
jgi:hypothetical protein